MEKLEKFVKKLTIWLYPLALCCLFWSFNDGITLPIIISVITVVYYLALIVNKIVIRVKRRKEKCQK